MQRHYNDTNKIERGKPRRSAIVLALFLFAIYLFVYRGGFHSVDEVSMFAVTESLVKFGRVNTDQIAWTQWTTSQAEAQGFFGIDGHVYSKKGLALSLAQAPLYWLGLVVPGLGMLQTVSLLNALVTAASGALIFMLVWRLGFSTTIALSTALIFGLATIAFVYAKYLFSEPLAGFLLLLAAYMLYAYRQEGGLRHIFIAGLAAGFAVMARANNLFLLPAFGLYLLWVENERRMGEFANLRMAARAQGRRGAGARGRRGAEVQGRENETKITQSAVRSPQSPSPITHHPSPLTPHSSLLTPHSSRFTAFLKHKSTWQTIIVFAAALTLPALLLLAYNAARAGNPLQTGYDLTLFSPNVVLGLYKLLFSPLRGLFVYSPLLLLSLPGWWLLRRSHPAEAWLFAGLVGITLALFSAWSSGEGLSWGSRFLVPIVPFLAICLAPVVQKLRTPLRYAAGTVVTNRELRSKDHVSRFPSASLRTGTFPSGFAQGRHSSLITHHSSLITFYALLILSLLIQLLGVTINPWVFLARIQAEFGGEFFLENTAALYDFRYSQIAGQLQAWSVENSDLVWWQPWGFDMVAVGVSAGAVLLAGWFLRQSTAEAHGRKGAEEKTPLLRRSPVPLLVVLALVTFFLLTRYYQTDRQFGPPDDGYTQALNQIAADDGFGSPVVTVAQYHYHVPMNRFKARHPLIGFAQQGWPPPDSARPLLAAATSTPNSWLVTIGFPPAAPDNAAEQWLARHTHKISDDWGDGSVRLLRFTAVPPSETRPIEATLGGAIRLEAAQVLDPARSGAPLPVELTFHTLAQPQADLTIFVQLLDIGGGVIAQTNSRPVGGYEPTPSWQPGQNVASRHGLLVPSEAPPGDYRLIAGLFDPTTGRRLPLDSGADFVDLGVLRIANCPTGRLRTELRIAAGCER